MAKRESADNIVFIGNKPVMNYVNFCRLFCLLKA